MIALVQGLLFLALAPLAGIHFDLLHLVMAIAAIAVVAFTLTIMGFVFAWKFDSVQGFHAIMNLVLMPMWRATVSSSPITRSASPRRERRRCDAMAMFSANVSDGKIPSSLRSSEQNARPRSTSPRWRRPPRRCS